MSFFGKNRKNKDAPDIREDDLIKVTSETGGPRVKIDDEDEDEVLHEYYIKLSNRVGVFKFVVLAALIVFILGMLTVFSTEITAHRFRYIMKDLNFEIPTEISHFGEISYTESAEQSFALFRGDVVCAGRESVEIVDVKGGRVLSEQLRYQKPVLLCGDRYFMVYDLTGCDFSVYNSFSLLYSEKTEHPISCAYMTSDGMFAIATRSDEYRTVVIIYNKSFDIIYKWSSNDKYLFDVILSDSGEFLLFCAYAEDGDFTTEIISGKTGQTTVSTVETISPSLVFGAEYFSSGNFAAYTESDILFYSADNRRISRYDFSAMRCRSFTVNGRYGAAVLSGAEEKLVVFGDGGAVLLSLQVSGELKDIFISEENLYLLYPDKISRINIKTSSEYEYANTRVVYDILELDGSVALAMTKTRAYVIAPEEFIEVS